MEGVGFSTTHFISRGPIQNLLPCLGDASACASSAARLCPGSLATWCRVPSGGFQLALDQWHCEELPKIPRRDLRKPSFLTLFGIWGFVSWKGARRSKNWNLVEDLNSCVFAFLPSRMSPLRTPVMHSGDMTHGYFAARFEFSVLCTKPLGNCEWSSKRPRQLTCKRFFNHYHLMLPPRRFCMNWNRWLVPQTFARCTRKPCPSYEMIKGRFVAVQRSFRHMDHLFHADGGGTTFSCRSAKKWMARQSGVLSCFFLGFDSGGPPQFVRVGMFVQTCQAWEGDWTRWHWCSPLSLESRWFCQERRIRSCWRPSHMVRKSSPQGWKVAPLVEGEGSERQLCRVSQHFGFVAHRQDHSSLSSSSFRRSFRAIPSKTNSLAANAGFLLQQAFIKPVLFWDLVANVDSMWERFFLICAKHSTALCGNWR